jgi:hypothetical protein
LNTDVRRIEQIKLAWQDEYGALSFGEKALAQVVSYIENQREIHADRQKWPLIEPTSDNEHPTA